MAWQTLVLAQNALARVLGVMTGRVDVNAASLLAPIPPTRPAADVSGAHPLAQTRQAAVDVARAQEDVLARTNRPRLYLQSALFARGTGAAFNGAFDGGASGLDSTGRTGWPECRWCSRISSTG